MQGFKSFADPVSIELNEGVTCIIGPNGSGKSNISDALRWVLGEQSSRQLRGSKMQDVIFAGTATRKPKGMAEVTLVIDNSSGILPLEYKEVAVTRRMFRSGESEYMINGNQCRLRDIRELFMDTGIGVEGYSIIGQGKIADIVSTRPENRRQIFEEAAGVVLYKTRKSEAESKLKTAQVNLDRVRDIIAEIESRIGGLKDESEKATEYIDLRDRYKTLNINIILHNLEGLERSISEGREELGSMQAVIDGMSGRLTEIDEIMEQHRQDESDLNVQNTDAGSRLLKIIEELNDLTSGGRLNEEKLANIAKEIERLDAEIAASESRLQQEAAELEKLEENDRLLNEETVRIENELTAAVSQFREHSGRAASLADQIEDLKDRMIHINNQNVTINAEINTLNNYRNTLSERRDTLAEEFESRDRTDADNRDNLARIESELTAKAEELEEARFAIKEINDKIISVSNTITQINSETEQLTVLSNRAIARKSTIEEMEANYEGYNNTVRLLMQRSMDGIIGTVSDIITVPEGYETAIETALGGSLQHIVCEDDDSAKAAIGWLKHSGSGRATFLPVRSVKADRLDLAEEIRSSAGFLGLASDMTDTDGRYREIVDYLLCRVIVADNMDNAVRMSKKKAGGFRIVTLDGEIVNSYGAITGGRFSNKTANLLDRKKEIQHLSDKIDGYAAKERELAALRDKAVSTEAALREDLEDSRSRVTDIEVTYNILLTDRDHAAEAVRNDTGAADRYKNELEVIDKDITRAEQMISDYKQRIEHAEEEYRSAEETADRLIDVSEALKPAIEEDNNRIVALKVKLGETESRSLARNEIIERVRDTVTEIKSTIEDNREIKAGLEKNREILTTSGEDSSDREKRLREEKQQTEDLISGIAAKLEDLRSDNSALLVEQKNIREELEGARDTRYRLELRTARNETLLDTNKEKLWDEFEVSYAEALDMRDPDFAITSGNRESREIRLRLAELGDVNISSIEEYKAVSKRYEFMTGQEADITKAMTELNEIIVNMDRTMRARFKENFDKVVVNFEQAFKELFGGGYAELRLEDENRPLESGIEITAQPPGKKLKNINLLSGGEKTLTAIALMFAVLKAKPTPFVILDEVEAALDEVNIERFSDYLKNFDNIQFALITHQKATMEHADVLYGVTMPEQGISRMLSLKLGDDFDVD